MEAENGRSPGRHADLFPAGHGRAASWQKRTRPETAGTMGNEKRSNQTGGQDMDWQPIETARKDGSLIWLGNKRLAEQGNGK